MNHKPAGLNPATSQQLATVNACSIFEPVDLSRATDEQLAMVNANFAGDSPELWRDIAELNFVALRAVSIFATLSDEDLALMSVNLVHQLVASFGGTQPYIPSGLKFHQSAKKDQIINEFNGRNIRRLSMKYHYSENNIRKIIQDDANSKKATTKK